MNLNKIRPKHLSRRAIIYLRQSTLRQVVENTESTTRQYALAGRAESLGWPKGAIEVIDEDLGQSGSSTEGRAGFRRLAEEVGRGQIGALFALEVSRFARSSADWHHLLDLCGWGDVLIVDEQGIFDPKDPNDRLLLGLKGQMSEAEKYWMRLRMHGAKLSRARRGELRLVPPTGYVWDPVQGRLALDPDEQVQAAVRLVFDRFRTEGSAHGVQTWFIREGLKFPARPIWATEVQWVNSHPRTVLDMLHSPIYTGAYVYGRRETRTSIVDGNARRTAVMPLPRDQWRVFLPDRHPAYLSWEEYLENQDKLKANRTDATTTAGHRAALIGAALLQGVLLCGRCGARMHVQYAGRNRRVVYLCRSPEQTGTGTGKCWMVSGAAIDEQVAAAFLAAAHPPELELAFAVTREAERQAGELDQQWKLRLERARYEARHAERRYKAVDPDNRVVARTLEAQWEERLREVEDVEHQYERARTQRKVTLTEDDRIRILELASDLPRVWAAKSTTQQQRKNLLRILVREVTLSPVDLPTRGTRVQVLWESGSVTDHFVERPQFVSGTQHAPGIDDTVRRLVACGKYDDQIAEILNQEGSTIGMGRAWDIHSVRRMRVRLGVARPGATLALTSAPDQRPDGLYSIRAVAARFGVSESMVRSWTKSGRLSVADGGGRGRSAWFNLDDETVARLEAHLGRRRNNEGQGAS
jgi:DNA invertase Pin-like site-specific DNA recombinase